AASVFVTRSLRAAMSRVVSESLTGPYELPAASDQRTVPVFASVVFVIAEGTASDAWPVAAAAGASVAGTPLTGTLPTPVRLSVTLIERASAEPPFRRARS